MHMSKHAVDYIFIFQAYGPIGITEKASNLFCRNNLVQVQAGEKHGRCQRLPVKVSKLKKDLNFPANLVSLDLNWY